MIKGDCLQVVKNTVLDEAKDVAAVRQAPARLGAAPGMQARLAAVLLGVLGVKFGAKGIAGGPVILGGVKSVIPSNGELATFALGRDTGTESIRWAAIFGNDSLHVVCRF
jgi:hypothetical protein